MDKCEADDAERRASIVPVIANGFVPAFKLLTSRFDPTFSEVPFYLNRIASTGIQALPILDCLVERKLFEWKESNWPPTLDFALTPSKSLNFLHALLDRGLPISFESNSNQPIPGFMKAESFNTALCYSDPSLLRRFLAAGWNPTYSQLVLLAKLPFSPQKEARLKIVHATGVQWTEEVFIAVATTSRISFLEHLVTEGCPTSVAAFISVAEHCLDPKEISERFTALMRLKVPYKPTQLFGIAFTSRLVDDLLFSRLIDVEGARPDPGQLKVALLQVVQLSPSFPISHRVNFLYSRWPKTFIPSDYFVALSSPLGFDCHDHTLLLTELKRVGVPLPPLDTIWFSLGQYLALERSGDSPPSYHVRRLLIPLLL